MAKFFPVSIFLLLCQSVSYAGGKASFDPQPYLDDFTQLEQDLGEAYPNLDSQVQALHLNLKKLDEDTRRALREAKSRYEALARFRRFLETFQDGHLKIEVDPQPAPEGKARVIARSSDPLRACEATMGAWKVRKPLSFHFPMRSTEGFRKVHLEENAFSWATLSMDKQKIGFIRIPSFGQGDYPDLCSQEWARYAKSLRQDCDQSCQEKFVYEVLPNRLIASFERALRKLEAEGISALAVDLTGNGGGTNWAGAVMRMLVNRPLKCGVFGFIRHPHWVHKLEAERAGVEERLAEANGTKKIEDIRGQLSRLSSELEEARKSCDRSSVWKSAAYQPGCSLVVKRSGAACSASKELHFHPGVYGGPLILLVDRKTASASEDLASRYQESGLARIVGEKTLGSGCGFTDGGIDFRLNNLGLKVDIPDCARFTSYGMNEVRGVFPDQLLNMEEMNSSAFVKKLKAQLSEALR